ncbi:MAG: GAF domain-containing protein [Candidatus Cloacimonetes bacterium]|nr:GAF domain-containing protein [Candidatus Cloacimonadota bacterium]
MSTSKIEKLQKIVHFNTVMNQTHDFNELLNIILKETEGLFDVMGTAIFLEDSDTGMLYFYIATGEKKDVLKTIRMPRGEGVCGYVFESGVSYVENHPQKSKFFSNKVDKKSKFVTHNLLAVPLKIKDKIIGVIELVNKKNSFFRKSDLEFLEIIASQVSITLERQRIVEEKIRAERLASMGETVAGLAHFIKNIVNGLSGGAYIINKQIGKVENPKLNTGWNMVKKNIDKISDLTLSMLAYSKDREPEYENVNINDLINEIIELVEERAKGDNIEIVTNFDDKIKEISADYKGIFRSILNLVTNGLDALEGRENARLTISTRKEKKNWIKIEIKDNGCGIHEEHLKKLFTKFFSTKGSKGTGLGLPVTKKIINEHKGTIKALSKINKGTAIIIKLPIEKIEK